MELRELNENNLDSLIKLYEQLDGANGDFTAEDARKTTVTKLFCKVPALEKKLISFIKILALTANLKRPLS